MPSLSSRYKSASKKEKGKILDEIICVTHGKYTTIRTYLVNDCFPYPERKLICDFYKEKIEDLFPIPALIK
jgi:hypothetical protein